jgi:hypothetical protein
VVRIAMEGGVLLSECDGGCDVVGAAMDALQASSGGGVGGWVGGREFLSEGAARRQACTHPHGRAAGPASIASLLAEP